MSLNSVSATAVITSFTGLPSVKGLELGCTLNKGSLCVCVGLLHGFGQQRLFVVLSSFTSSVHFGGTQRYSVYRLTARTAYQTQTRVTFVKNELLLNLYENYMFFFLLLLVWLSSAVMSKLV